LEFANGNLKSGNLKIGIKKKRSLKTEKKVEKHKAE
jgi:hypothetical protein